MCTDRKAAGVAGRADRPLAGKVALVAGATRGAGRAIAIELGAAGATCSHCLVYVIAFRDIACVARDRSG